MKPVDIEKIVESKNPSLSRRIPGFFFRYLKRVIHQREINQFLSEHGEKQGLAFCNEVLRYFDLSCEIVGMEKIPTTGGAILASNHPLGGLDAMALIAKLGEVRTDLKFLVNDILMNLNNLDSIFVPVNKHGKNSSDYIERINSVYDSDNLVLLFPAGLVSRKVKGEVKDLEWKKSFVTKAKKVQKSIFPVFIGGKNSNFFYRLSRWRQWIGIKANIEMLYLVDEMYKQRGNTIRLVVGNKIDCNVLSNQIADKDWAASIREHVYKLENDHELNFNL